MIQCAVIIDATQGQSAEQNFGWVDAQKLHSSITLVLQAAPGEPVLGQVLEHDFGGIPDTATDKRT